MAKIKFHDISRLYNQHSEALEAINKSILSTGNVLGGERVRLLERQVSKLIGQKYAKAVGSCTDALSLSLMALGIGKGDDVAVSPFTFPASYTCIKRVGANIVWVDINPDTFQMDMTKLKRSVKAIIIPNMFGQLAEKPKTNIPVIEDAAQSFTAGTLNTQLMCLSFDPTKIMPAFGTGGMVVTDDPALIDKVSYYSYRNYGSNSQLDEVKSAYVSYWLLRKDELEAQRTKIADSYNKALASIGEVTTPLATGKHIYHKYVIKCKGRDKLKTYLAMNGIETKIHYNVNIPECPVATRVSKEVLSLPMYPTLSKLEQRKVTQWIRKFYS